jgi:hypothetical protein
MQKLAGHVFVAVSASVGCVIGPSSPDAGAVDAGSQTISDQCDTIANAFCTRAISGCGVVYTLSQCIADEVATCCNGANCRAISKSSASAVAACTSAIGSEDCNSVVNSGPSALAECQGVPHS